MSPTVIYICAWGHSGTTLLDRLIGLQPGAFSTGELHSIWTRSLDKRICGCQRVLAECPVWSAILEDAFGSLDKAALVAKDMARWQSESLLMKHFRRQIRGPRGSVQAASESYSEVMTVLYESIARITGCTHIVDSSKTPTYAVLLQRAHPDRGRFIHLVRDPRASAHSWIKAAKKANQTTREGLRIVFRTGGSTSRWVLWNLAAELVARKNRGAWTTMRYEDLATSPHSTLEEALEGVGVPFAPFELQASIPHTVGGNNRVRFETLEKVSLDERWLEQMPARSKIFATGVALPLLHRYRYPLNPKNAALRASSSIRS